MSDFHPQVCLVVQDRCQSSHQHSHFGHEDKERGAGQKVCAPTLNQPSSKLFQKPHSFHFIPYLFLYKKMLPRISRFCYSERREEWISGKQLPFPARRSKPFSFSPQSVLRREKENTQREIGKWIKWVWFDYFSQIWAGNHCFGLVVFQLWNIFKRNWTTCSLCSLELRKLNKELKYNLYMAQFVQGSQTGLRHSLYP